MNAPTPPLAHDPLAPLARVALLIAAVSIAALVVVQAWQVVARYLLNDSPGWTEPVAVLLLCSAMSFGAAAGVHARAHFGFFLMAQSVSPGMRRVLAAISHLVVLTIGAVLAYWSARLLVDGLDIRMAGAPLPQSANFAPLLCGSALMTLFALQALVRELLGTAPEARS
jgi:TRAP-type C4-dicarboxylate transport system permease small subunit